MLPQDAEKRSEKGVVGGKERLIDLKKEETFGKKSKLGQSLSVFSVSVCHSLFVSICILYLCIYIYLSVSLFVSLTVCVSPSMSFFQFFFSVSGVVLM